MYAGSAVPKSRSWPVRIRGFVALIVRRRKRMTNDQPLRDLSRHIANLVTVTKSQNRILEDLSAKLAALVPTKSESSPPAPTEEGPKPLTEYIPAVYGWSAANLHQREGTLRMGDIKMEEDESRWVWTGETWNRLEDPSSAGSNT